MERRDFLKNTLLTGAVTAAPAQILQNNDKKLSPRIKLGVSSYSYWHFKGDKFPLEKVIDHAAEIGLDGVDILHRQMETEDNAYLQKIKKHAFLNGIALTCLSIHQGFVTPDPEELKKNVDHTKKCIELAARMGIPCMRLNTGRWNTIKSFDELMKNRGVEPILPGYTEDDGFKWCADGIRQCLKTAEDNGVLLALENHWGLGSTPEGMLRLHKEVNSPWLGLLMDTGNFLEEPYEKLRKIAPYTSFVQAKTYYGGGEWYSLDLDYNRIMEILSNIGYKGYVSIEFEGKAEPYSGVKQSVLALRKALNSLL
jgi:sugar phosphate isomerase/epimerase